MLKRLPLDKINGSKNALSLLSRAPTYHSFTFNFRFLYDLKHKIHFSKTVQWIFHFRFRFIFITVYIFVQQNATQSFAPRPLIFKLQQDVLKFNDICVSWSFPKSDLVTNVLNLEHRSFENISLSQ